MSSITIASDPYYLDTIQEYYGDSLEREDVVWREYCLQNNLPATTTPDSLTGASLANWQIFLSTYPQQILWAKYQGLWQAFAADQGIPSTSVPSTTEIQTAFRQFVQRCLTWGVPLDVISSTNSVPPDSSYDFYRTFMTSNFGDISPTLQNMLWNKFIKEQGYSVVGPVYQNPADSISLREAFSQFISAIRGREITNEAALALSPYEIESRVVAFEIINAISEMLSASQQQVKVQAQTLMFLGQYQQMYTNMMTSVPTLTSGPSGTLSIGAQSAANIDANNFTFGYYKITLHQLVQWGISEAKASPGTTITWGNSSTMGTYSFTYNTGTSGSPDTVSVRFTVVNDAAGVSGDQLNTFNAVYEQGDTNSSNETLGTPLTLADLVSKAEKNTIAVFSRVPNCMNLNGVAAIPGRWLSSGADDTTGQNAQIQGEIESRTEQNAILQQYTSNIRSLRTLISNRSTQLQSILDSARDSINQTSNLWTSILESINTCMKAVFKAR